MRRTVARSSAEILRLTSVYEIAHDSNKYVSLHLSACCVSNMSGLKSLKRKFSGKQGRGPQRKRPAEDLTHNTTRAPRVGFLDLPRELRDCIYEQALVADCPISVLNLTTTWRHHVPRQTLRLTPALLLVSRTLHTEGTDFLYGHNAFFIEIELTLKDAQQRYEISKTLRSMHLPPDLEPLEPDVVCTSDRPMYSHPRLACVKSLEVKIRPKYPTIPTWREPFSQFPARTDHRFADLCRFLVEKGDLDLLIVHTEGYGLISDWNTAAAYIPEFARHMHLVMMYYHEWHIERALLAAARRQCAFWIDEKNKSAVQEMQQPILHTGLRALTNAVRPEPRPLQTIAHLPKRFLPRGELRTNSWLASFPETVRSAHTAGGTRPSDF